MAIVSKKRTMHFKDNICAKASKVIHCWTFKKWLYPDKSICKKIKYNWILV